MFSILLDTSVLLDYLSADRPEHALTVDALRACLVRPDIRVAVPACLLKDVYFIYERHNGSEQDARRIITLIRQAFEVIDLTLAIVDAAIACDEPDFEDAVVRMTAESIRADAIFSRDGNAYQSSPIPRMDAREILELISSRTS